MFHDLVGIVAPTAWAPKAKSSELQEPEASKYTKKDRLKINNFCLQTFDYRDNPNWCRKFPVA